MSRESLELLIDGCRKGHRTSQKTLYDRYSGLHYSICLRYCRHEQDAQDALQDGWIRIFRYIDRYESTGSFEGWMRRIIVNASLTVLKSRGRYHTTEIMEHMATATQLDGLDLLGAAELHRHIRALPDGYRTVFNLSVIEGYSHQEIAEKLGIGESTSRSQLVKARRMLQGMIETAKKPYRYAAS